MNNEDFITKERVAARIALLREMIDEKAKQLSALVEILKKLDGSAFGAKDVSEKIDLNIKKQQSDVTVLAAQQKISQDFSKFVNSVLETVRMQAKSTCAEHEYSFFSKQGEALFLQQEIEKLSKTLQESEQQLSQIEESQKKSEQEKAVSEISENLKTKKRVRPDKDPSTRIGRAAIDIATRKKKVAKEKSL